MARRGNISSNGNGNGNRSSNGNGNGKNGKKTTSKQPKLSPQQVAVVIGLLTDALDVLSVLVDRDQNIQIVLQGSLRKKTKVDQLVDDLGDVSVSDLIEAFIRK